MVAAGFACDKHFGRIPWPRIKFYAAGQFKDRTGFYHARERTVWLDAGLDDEMLIRTSLHEASHHYEECKNLTPTEGFAWGQERLAIAKWNADRQHQMAVVKEIVRGREQALFEIRRERLRKQIGR
jgi:hypothetical protein